MHRVAQVFRAAGALCLLCGWNLIALAEPNTLAAARSFSCHGIDGRPAVVSSVALTADGQLILAASDAHEISIMETATGAVKRRLTQHVDWSRTVTFSASSQLTASSGLDRTILLANLPEQSPQIALPFTDAIFALAVHPSGQQFAAVGFDNTVRIVNLSANQPIQTFECAGNDQRAVAISPSGERMAAAGRNGRIRIWNLISGTQERDIETEGRPIRTLVFSPNSQFLAAAGDAPMVRIYDSATGQETRALEIRPSKVFALAYVSEQSIVTAGSDNLIRIWDLATAQCSLQLVGHTGTVTSLAVAPGGSTLVSGSYDTTIRVWELPTASQPTRQPITADRYAPPRTR
jgi:WD40 repeat protein